MASVKYIKAMFAKLEEAEAAYDAADADWEADPESAEAEAAWDAAYNALWEAEQAVAEAIESFTGGMVDCKTARRMVTIKRDQLQALIARAA